jgi:5'-AMP-activated protein kinase, regulatory beta subunit
LFSSQGDFVTIVDLPEGEHEYKFLVDGEWKYDSGKVTRIYSTFFFTKLIINLLYQAITDSNEGSKTNLVSVKQSDFEVFQALAIDSVNEIILQSKLINC